MCKSIIDTLPTGFYTGRRIPVELDENISTSYYSVMEDSIKVSYKIIAERMEQVKEGTCDAEEAVRSMLYHEVSHAILTPQRLENSTKVNIFEDERIETVLKNYFHGVNFKKQLYDLHGGEIPTATNGHQAFFNAVRFGLGTAMVQSEVRRLLEKYKTLNRASDYYDSEPNCCQYQYDINKLYRLITKDFETQPEEFNPKGQSGTGSGSQKDMDQLGQSDFNNTPDKDSDNENVACGASDENQQEINEHTVTMTAEALKRMVGSALSHSASLTGEEQAKLADFQKTVEMIIGNFNKKNSGGSGINTYSGVFNPRAVARKDYKFFERAMSTQGNNKFGTCHLNLLIDCSGSFCNNVQLTNAILATLSEVERKNRNFTMDVAFINEELRLCASVKERTLKANGGNKIPKETKEVLRKLQKPLTCNYNIILFDGDACSDEYGSNRSEKFHIFDMKQTTLITDPDNERYMQEPFTSTKVVVTKDYTGELIDHIIHALSIAFG